MSDNQYRDNDGFYSLVRRTPVVIKESKPKEKDDEPKKVKWPKFNKGSWKATALKSLRKFRRSKDEVDFHFVRNDNLVVSFGKKAKVFKFHNRLDLLRLKALNKASEDTRVLLNAGEGQFLSISTKSYIKLCDIDRMYIKFTLSASYDDDSSCEIYQSEQFITTINQLAWYIIHHQHCIDGVYDVQAECYGFADYHFKFKILVIHNNHEVETFKGDMNDFMEKYHLRLF